MRWFELLDGEGDCGCKEGLLGRLRAAQPLPSQMPGREVPTPWAGRGARAREARRRGYEDRGRTGLNSGKDLVKVEKKSMGALRCLSVCNLHGKRIKFPLFSPSCSRGMGGVGFGPGREPPT